MASSTLLTSQFRDLPIDENSNPKSKDCLTIKPNRELTFKHSRSKYSADLHLINKKDEPVLYKIRTTAAKSYIVLPTVGLIPPYGSASVKICMPAKEDIKERLGDKFLIQAFPYTRNDLGDDSKLMNQVFEQYYKSLTSKEVQNTRLRVYFENHTVIEEEMSEETFSAKHGSPSTAMTREVDRTEPSSSLLRNKAESYSISSTKKPLDQMRTVLSPEPESGTKSESKLYDTLFTPVLKEQKIDSLSELSNRTKSENYKPITPITPETYTYQTPADRSRGYEQETTSGGLLELPTVQVSRNLRNEFDVDHSQKRASLTSLTNSLPRSYNTINDNDISIHTEISDVKSNMSLSEQLAAYKYKLDLLDHKFNEQRIQMARLIQEREMYHQEVQSFRRASATSLLTPADDSKLQQKNKPQMDVWHLMILCIVCMILGSIFR